MVVPRRLPHGSGATKAAPPGHQGLLNHLSWCLRLLAGVQEDLSDTAEAAPLRRREAEVKALLATQPEK